MLRKWNVIPESLLTIVSPVTVGESMQKDLSGGGHPSPAATTAAAAATSPPRGGGAQPPAQRSLQHRGVAAGQLGSSSKKECSINYSVFVSRFQIILPLKAARAWVGGGRVEENLLFSVRTFPARVRSSPLKKPLRTRLYIHFFLTCANKSAEKHSYIF